MSLYAAAKSLGCGALNSVLQRCRSATGHPCWLEHHAQAFGNPFRRVVQSAMDVAV